MASQATKYLLEKNSSSPTPPWQVVDTVGERAIGVFDSGIGGFTVLRALTKKLPKEKFLYYADTAAGLYGRKSREEIRERAYHCRDFLLERRVKAIVIACHTASLLVGEEFRHHLSIPLIDMVGPTIALTAKTTRNRSIALWGTHHSARPESYPHHFARLSPPIVCRASPLSSLVEWIESGSAEIPYEEIVRKECADIEKSEADTLVLGCTHFPFLAPLLDGYLPEGVQVVNPAEATAEWARERLGVSTVEDTSLPSPVEIIFSGQNTLSWSAS